MIEKINGHEHKELSQPACKVEIIPQSPPAATELLNKWAAEGWNLKLFFPIMVNHSMVQPEPVAALYCYFERN